MTFDPKLLLSYPVDPGVYLMKNRNGTVLYVGKAKCLRSRLKQYFEEGRDSRKMIPLLIAELETIETIVVFGEKEALILENRLIKQYRPKYNILLRDDKNYVSLRLNPQEPWPRLTFERYIDKPKDEALRFGPYTGGSAARNTFDLMAKLFPLRQCSDEEFRKRTRPCLLYDIKRCLAPCVGKCSEAEYQTYVKGAIDFLQGKNKEVLRSLKKRMEEAAEATEFETAAMLLKTIRQIEHVTESSDLSSQAKNKNLDVLGFACKGDKIVIVKLGFRNGSLIGSESFFFENIVEENEEVLLSFLFEYYTKSGNLPETIVLPFPLTSSESVRSALKEIRGTFPKLRYPEKGNPSELLQLAQKNADTVLEQKTETIEFHAKLLSELQETLLLRRYPERIECFDTSHLSGSDPVAASVTFFNGTYDRKQSKLYHMKHFDVPDDYAALRQVLTRRLLKTEKEGDLPDLLIVDGGKGQLRIAQEVLESLQIVTVDLISLVKDNARHDKGLTLDKVFIRDQEEPIGFPFHSPLLFFLQNIRDKVHEKAISFHRKTKRKKITRSVLDNVPGIGPVKKTRLLQRFGSVQNILSQPDEILLAVPGITEVDVSNIKKFAF